MIVLVFYTLTCEGIMKVNTDFLNRIIRFFNAAEDASHHFPEKY